MNDPHSTTHVSEMFCPTCGGHFPGGLAHCNDDGTALLPCGVGDDPSGRVVKGKYVLVTRLGEGSYGTVYKAIHRLARSEVAIKFLKADKNDDPKARKQFLKEAHAVMRLHTKHAVEVKDIDEEDGQLFIVMELLKGPPLDRYLKDLRKRGEKLPEQDVVRMGAEIAEALDEAHSQGVIHRDLKPANVVVEPGRDGLPHAKVVDFGIAKLALSTDIEMATTESMNRIFGTPPYMSPEQCRGLTLDHRSDLYALGIVLYEMLTGERPFRSETAQGFMVAHMTETPMRPTEAFVAIRATRALEDLVMRLLEKDPRNRPQTAGEVLQVLAALGGGTPTRVMPTATPAKERGRSGAGRRWALWAVLGLGLAGGILAALLAWGGGTAEAPESAAAPAEQPLEPAAASVTAPAPAPVPAPVASPAVSSSPPVVTATSRDGTATTVPAAAGGAPAPAPAPATSSREASASPGATAPARPASPSPAPAPAAKAAASTEAATAARAPEAAAPTTPARVSAPPATPTAPAAKPAPAVAAPRDEAPPSFAPEAPPRPRKAGAGVEGSADSAFDELDSATR